MKPTCFRGTFNILTLSDEQIEVNNFILVDFFFILEQTISLRPLVAPKSIKRALPSPQWPLFRRSGHPPVRMAEPDDRLVSSYGEKKY